MKEDGRHLPKRKKQPEGLLCVKKEKGSAVRKERVYV